MKGSKIIGLGLGLCVFAAFMFSNILYAADVPQEINYQGFVKTGGSVFSGAGWFKIAIVNADGDTTYWSNDGTSSDGSEPDEAVSATVSDGLFNIILGDTTITNMTQAIPPSVFIDHSDVYLRVWFSDGSGFEHLTPDKKITSSAYAFNAYESSTVADSAVTTVKINDDAVTTAKIANDNVTEVKLDVTNTPSVNQILSYAGSNQFTWVNPPAAERYVDRGDPASDDWDNTDLTCNGTWQTLNLLSPSIIAPAGANHLVHLTGKFVAADAGATFRFRKKGNENTHNVAQTAVQFAGGGVEIMDEFLVMCNENCEIEYCGTNCSWPFISITVRGWWQDE